MGVTKIVEGSRVWLSPVMEVGSERVVVVGRSSCVGIQASEYFHEPLVQINERNGARTCCKVRER